MSGWSLLETSGQIAKKIRKYMLIRTVASAVTGLAVFVFTLSIGLDLAVAWGIISFVLNYIPYVGPLVAVILPVIFATAQFEILADGGSHFRKFVPDPICDRQLSRADADWHSSRDLTIRDAVRIFNLDFLWGMPGAFIGLPVTIALFTIWEQNPSTRWIANLMSTSDAASDTQLAKTS